MLEASLALTLDALLISLIGGGAIMLCAFFLSRCLDRRTSPQVHYQLLLGALLSSVSILAVVMLLEPQPVGCLSRTCSAGEVHTSGWSQRQFTYAAAGKFADVAESHGRHLHSSDAASPVANSSQAWIAAALLLWSSGTAIVLSNTVRRRILTARLIRQAAPINNARVLAAFERARRALGFGSAVRLLHHRDVDVPVAGGILRPVIFLPRDLENAPAAHVEMIVLHELAHLARRDPLATLMAEITTACFWFNPLVWAMARRVRELQELAADSRVLNAGIKPSSYARCLLDTFRNFALERPAQERHPSPIGHSILGDCLIETRLRTVLDAERTHEPPSRVLTFGTAALLIALSAAAAFAPGAASQAAEGIRQSENVAGLTLEASHLDAITLDAMLRPIFIDIMAKHQIAGAAIAIVHGDELIYDQGFGHREVYQEKPVEAHQTIFRIGSISKVVTGVAVMQLVDRGLLDLDANVNDYLTAFKVPDTFPEPVRVRHLLTHTAGFDQIGLGRHVRQAEDVLPLGVFLKNNLIRIRPPGEVSCYDTYAITLAGYLVEQLSGLSFEDYLQTNIFRPLGMHRSGIAIPPALANDRSVGYFFGDTWRAKPWEFMNTDPASTINSTATDMANFAIMMLQDGEFEGQKILTPGSARAMLTQQHTNHPDHPGYGLTFFEDRSHGVPSFGHGGSMEGFGAYLHLVPEFDLGIYLSYNQESGVLPDAVLTRLMAELFPDRSSGHELRPRVEKPSDLARFAGTYANNMYHHTNPMTGWVPRPQEIKANDQGIVFKDKLAYQVGALDFQRDDGVLLSFREDAQGEISYLFINQTAFERLPQ